MLRTSFITCALLAVASAAAAQAQVPEPPPRSSRRPRRQRRLSRSSSRATSRASCGSTRSRSIEAINKAGTESGDLGARAGRSGRHRQHGVGGAAEGVRDPVAGQQPRVRHPSRRDERARPTTSRWRCEPSAAAGAAAPPDKERWKGHRDRARHARSDDAGGDRRDSAGPVSPSQAYSDYVREALLDSMVDQGHLLPIGPGSS